jgi:hypothetical protein
MFKKDTESRDRLAIAVTGVIVLLMVVPLPPVTHAAPLDLPPRPPTSTPAPMPPRPPTSTPAPMPPRPPTPTPVPTLPGPASSPDLVDGALIELRSQFIGERLWARVNWQDLWVVVEWQDRSDNWHAVEGWQGTFDEFNDGVGKKVWWVGKADFGKGPFRWVVYEGQGGKWLVKSESFFLPQSVCKTVKVEVSLEP